MEHNIAEKKTGKDGLTMSMFHLFAALIRAVFLSRAALAAENLALRQQLIVLRRSVEDPGWVRFPFTSVIICR